VLVINLDLRPDRDPPIPVFLLAPSSSGYPSSPCSRRSPPVIRKPEHPAHVGGIREFRRTRSFYN
jgi:hypothetical protein